MKLLIINILRWFWGNFIGKPWNTSRFTGLLRTAVWLWAALYISIHNVDGNFFIALLGLYATLQACVGFFFQFAWGAGGKPLPIELQKAVNAYDAEERARKESGIVDIRKDYPEIYEWFRVRENKLSGMSPREGAQFFIQTGGLTEGSIQNMHHYPQTREALSRLNHELKIPPHEKVRFMLGQPPIKP